MRFRFEPTTGPDTVQVAIQIELQQIGRVISRSSGCLGLNPLETCRCQIEAVDKCIDEANRVVHANIVVHQLRKEQELRTIITRNVRRGRSYHCARRHGTFGGFSHSLDRIPDDPLREHRSTNKRKIPARRWPNSAGGNQTPRSRSKACFLMRHIFPTNCPL